MRIIRILAALIGATLVAGCSTLWSPYPYSPSATTFDGTFPSAIAYLDKIHDDLDTKLKDTDTIRTTTELGTLAGFGGAALAAVARASTETVLGFSGLGVASLTANGLFGSTVQSRIYNAGRAALSCVYRTVGPLIAAHNQLVTYQKGILKDVAAVADRRTAVGDNSPDTVAKINEATAALGKIATRLQKDDSYASQITSAGDSIVQAVYEQLLEKRPDASAMARAGASLSTATFAAEKDTLGGLRPNAQTERLTTSDPELAADLAQLKADTDAANALTGSGFSYPAITCTVATVTVVAMTVTGLTGNQVQLTQGEKVNYHISGGVPPYARANWEGNLAGTQTITVTPLADSIQIEAAKTTPVGTRQLRIFDSGNSSVLLTIEIVAPPAVPPPVSNSAARTLSFKGPGSVISLAAGQKSDLFSVSGGSGDYDIAVDKSISVDRQAPAVDKSVAFTLTPSAATPATSTLTITDKQNTALTLRRSVRVSSATARTPSSLTLTDEHGKVVGDSPSPLVLVKRGAEVDYTIGGGSGDFIVSSSPNIDAELSGVKLAVSPRTDAPLDTFPVTVTDKNDNGKSITLRVTVQQ